MLGRPQASLRTNAVITEVPQLPMINFHGKMCFEMYGIHDKMCALKQNIAKCMGCVALL